MTSNKVNTVWRMLGIAVWVLAPSQLIAQKAEGEINQLMDGWHLAASKAEFDNYFDPIHEKGRFLGTDASERWTKKEFIKFSRPFFDKGKAWDFKAKNRMVFVDADGKYAWFDEVLDTWMGSCRGSGILMKTNDGWKIMQYSLAILVANEDVASYLTIIRKEKKE